ncbi:MULTISPECIES: hypothetical protein [unclassified Spiroplasma]|uniref:hypothetical protein n=1 Tax=unclassified Spiroplasma TaxID=2637901 RepID=UPI0030D59CEB
MELNQLWEITSYNDYFNNWRSTVGQFSKLTSYQKSLGYATPEEFFNAQMITAQQMANEKIGNMIDNPNWFNSRDLPAITQENLKRFTYRAMDYLPVNDYVVVEDDRVNISISNGSRTDSTVKTPKLTIDGLLGDFAWRAWRATGLEHLYSTYLAKKNETPLLDPKQFYDKQEIDAFLLEIDNTIQEEHSFAEIETTKNRDLIVKIETELTSEINQKQNIADQILYQQATDDEGQPVGPIEKLGQFDEILEISRYPANAVVTTPEGKKRAILNHNILGEVKDAMVVQSTSDSDLVNAIGRVWGYGVENDVMQAKTDIAKNTTDITNNKSNIGDITQLTTDQKDNLTNAINSTNDKFDLLKNNLYKDVTDFFKTKGSLLDINKKYLIVAFGIINNKELYFWNFVKPNYQEVSPGVKTSQDIFLSSETNVSSTQAGVISIKTSWVSISFPIDGAIAREGIISLRGNNCTFDVTKSQMTDSKNLSGQISEFSVYEYNGQGIPLPITFDKPISNQKINFTIPYWEKQHELELAEEESKRLKRENAKLSDIKPLEDQISEIKPIVDGFLYSKKMSIEWKH